MSIKRYAAKRDANEMGIAEALRGVGATVMFVDKVDLIVGFRSQNYLIEVKSKGGRITPSQKTLIESWEGQYAVVWSIDEALRVIGAIE